MVLRRTMAIIISKSHDGLHTLEFDNKKHLYVLDGNPVGGVTTINKKGFPTSEKLINWYKRNGMRSNKLANDAADIGKMVHKYAELTVEGKSGEFNWEDVEKHKGKIQIKNCIKHFTSWHQKNTTRTMGSEMLVASPQYKFGGMLDRLALDLDDNLGIEDYKTSSGFFIDQFIQMSGYKIAVYEWKNLDVKWLRINLFTKQDGDFHTLLVNQEGWYLDGNLWVVDKFAMIKLQNQFISNLKTFNFVNEYEPIFDKIYDKLQEEMI